MKKEERDYIERLVADANRKIKDVYLGALYEFMNHDQREGYIQGVASAIEPFAELVGLEVAGVDLNRMQ